MPEFFHALPEAKGYFELIADENDILPAAVEKDYFLLLKQAIDMIFLDLMLPEISGREVLTYIFKSRPKTARGDHFRILHR